MRKIFLILFIFITSFSFAQGDKLLSDAPPAIRKYVVDETGTLTSSQINSLMTKIIDFEKATSNQIVVYIIKSLDGDPIENVAVSIAEKNKIGKKDKNNGVLLLVAMNDRKMRIEVGYGLEGALTDAISSQIINKDLKPAFKEGKYYDGINKAVDHIIAATKGEYTADEKGNQKVFGCIGAPLFIILIFAVIFISIIISVIRRAMGFGRGVVTGRRGSTFGDVGTGFLLGSLFSNMGNSGSSHSSGNSDFGGFSGGGGSFGGGGASGDW